MAWAKLLSRPLAELDPTAPLVSTMLRRTAASVGLTHADVLALAEFGSRLWHH